MRVDVGAACEVTGGGQKATRVSSLRVVVLWTTVWRWGAHSGQHVGQCFATTVAQAFPRFGQGRHIEVQAPNAALRDAVLQATLCCRASVDWLATLRDPASQHVVHFGCRESFTWPTAMRDPVSSHAAHSDRRKSLTCPAARRGPASSHADCSDRRASFTRPAALRYPVSSHAVHSDSRAALPGFVTRCHSDRDAA